MPAFCGVNAAGVIVANSLAQLHDPANVAAGGALDATWAINDRAIPLDETGAQVPSGGAGGNVHDILTETLLDDTVAANETCLDWTSGVDDPNIAPHPQTKSSSALAADDERLRCWRAGLSA